MSKLLSSELSTAHPTYTYSSDHSWLHRYHGLQYTLYTYKHNSFHRLMQIAQSDVYNNINGLTASATAAVTAVAPSCAAMVAFLSMFGLISSRWTKSYKYTWHKHKVLIVTICDPLWEMVAEWLIKDMGLWPRIMRSWVRVPLVAGHFSFLSLESTQLYPNKYDGGVNFTASFGGM